MAEQTGVRLGRAATLRIVAEGSAEVADMITEAAAEIDPLLDGGAYRNICVLFAGTNDLFFGASAATTIARVEQFCSERQAAGWLVVVATILPRSNVGTPLNFETDRQTVNSDIRANWADYADALADVGADATIGEDNDELNLTYYADLVHLTFAGREVAAAVFAAAINGLL